MFSLFIYIYSSAQNDLINNYMPKQNFRRSHQHLLDHTYFTNIGHTVSSTRELLSSFNMYVCTCNSSDSFRCCSWRLVTWLEYKTYELWMAWLSEMLLLRSCRALSYILIVQNLGMYRVAPVPFFSDSSKCGSSFPLCQSCQHLYADKYKI